MRFLLPCSLLLPLLLWPRPPGAAAWGGAPMDLWSERGAPHQRPAPGSAQRPTPPPAQGPGAGRGAQRERAPQPTVDPEQAELYFQVADYDGDGWISWREAQRSLRLDKLRFEQIDANGDGLIDREEFLAAFRRTVERLGAYPPPIPLPGSEGERLLAGAIEAERAGAPAPVGRAASVIELFGAVQERSEGSGVLHQPPRIAGPIEAFLRLDLDRDGHVTDLDLDRLQRPIQLPVRRNTVLASLDANGDGVIDREEFYSSMRGARPASE